MRRILTAVFLVMAAAAASTGQPAVVDVDAIGPRVGQQVPSFDLPDQNGQRRTLSSLLGPKGGMLVFFRSADW
jgi:cytochrome oxidase Cu insertion factor (SCO1/SenC/PrrC family)